MKPIYLVGFMGSGKSTVGRFLHKEYRLSFIDTDTYISETSGKEIERIFAEDGEETFRQYEVDALVSLMDFDVIATGGGIVEREENRQHMNKYGTVIYLQTSFSEIMKRLKNDAARPLWNQDVVEREKLYNRRHEIYLTIADKVVQTDNSSIEDIAHAIISSVHKE